MTPTNRTSLPCNLRGVLQAAILLAAASLPLHQASAVSSAVASACAGDYLSYCSAHPVGSAALRKCMSANGERLSQGCIDALVAAGEISKAEVARRTALGR